MTRYPGNPPGLDQNSISTVPGWLPIFTRQKHPDIATDSLTCCRQQKCLLLHKYVIVDNHVHMMISSDNLSEVIRDFKRQPTTEHMLRQKLDYIHYNHIKLGLVDRPEYCATPAPETI